MNNIKNNIKTMLNISDPQKSIFILATDGGSINRVKAAGAFVLFKCDYGDDDSVYKYETISEKTVSVEGESATNSWGLPNLGSFTQ